MIHRRGSRSVGRGRALLLALSLSAAWAAFAGPLAGPAVAAACSPASQDSTPIPPAAQHVVVLVHGWDGEPSSWGDPCSPSSTDGYLSRQLGSGYTFLRFSYKSLAAQWAADPRIRDPLADYLVRAAAASSDHHVIVVAHSMGGIAALFAMTSAPQAAAARAAVRGLITLSAPYRGSPWGDTALASTNAELLGPGTWQDIFHAELDHTPAAIMGQSGGLPSGARCLAPPSRLPADCTPVPSVPSDLPVAAYGGSVQVARTLFGHTIAVAYVGGDGIVPVDSATLGARPNGPSGEAYLSSCGITGGAVTTGLRAAGLTIDAADVLIANLDKVDPARWISEDVASHIVKGTDVGALLSTDKVVPDVGNLTLAVASLFAPCFHSHIVTVPDVLNRVSTQIRSMLANAPLLPLLPETAANAKQLQAMLTQANVPLHSSRARGCGSVFVYGAQLITGDADVAIGGVNGSCGGDGGAEFFQIRAARVVAHAIGTIYAPHGADADVIIRPYGIRRTSEYLLTYTGQNGDGTVSGIVLLPVPSIEDFVGTWSGHGRQLQVDSSGSATVDQFNGCCDKAAHVRLELTGTPERSGDAITMSYHVQAVQVFNPSDFSAAFPAPRAGQVGTVSLTAGVITTTLLNHITFCDVGGDETGACGA